MNGQSVTPDSVLQSLFQTAVRAVLPEHCLAQHLPSRSWPGRTLVISVGKAGASMAQVASAYFGPNLEGLVVVPPGHGVPQDSVAAGLEVIEAGHPVPNEHSLRAATRALELAHGLGPEDRLIALISGGGSALLALPTQGLSLSEKQGLTKALLMRGATIAQMNCVRKQVSSIKGGRLAQAAAPARVETYLISDVPGDDPTLIASGPTLANPQSVAEARAIVQRFYPEAPASVWAALDRAESDLTEPLHWQAIDSPAIIVASADLAFKAAIAHAEALGLHVDYLGDDLEGEARMLARQHATLALNASHPSLVLSGGETTVSLPVGSKDRHQTSPRGGRNLDYLLSLAIALDGAPDIHAIACDTDGIDGSSNAAGALLTPSTLTRARALGLDPEDFLQTFRAHDFFAALGDLVVTGPTRTNVNDFRAILVGEGSQLGVPTK